MFVFIGFIGFVAFVAFRNKKFILTSDLRQICQGRITEVFKKFDSTQSITITEQLQEKSFSLIFKDRTLDVEDKQLSQEEIQRWCQSFTWLKEQTKSQPNSSPVQLSSPITAISAISSSSSVPPLILQPSQIQTLLSPSNASQISIPTTTNTSSNTILNVASPSMPYNVKHVTHVNAQMQWETNLEQTIVLEQCIGKGAFGEGNKETKTSTNLKNIQNVLLDFKPNPCTTMFVFCFLFQFGEVSLFRFSFFA